MAKWDKKYFVTELRDVVGAAPWSPVFAVADHPAFA